MQVTSCINSVLILVAFLLSSIPTASFMTKKIHHKNSNTLHIMHDINKKNTYSPFNKQKIFGRKSISTKNNDIPKKYTLTKPDFIEKIKKLNSKNTSIQTDAIMNIDESDEDFNLIEDFLKNLTESIPKRRIIIKGNSFIQSFGSPFEDESNVNGYFDEDEETGRRRFVKSANSKSKNFEVINTFDVMFKDVGGYDNVKQELIQCIDLLKNYEKYTKYNVRIPKGLVLEGPPGTGKTLFAKALAGESKCNFIPVSGSDFQEKYVGVGSTRVKELFELAKKNIPCIIFIDEIDAVGRKRASDGESSSNERDNTLNALLVELDGFKNNTGVFLVAATNRIDLLDSALTRPGRIDKSIYIGLPDKATREEILKIHIEGKPYSNSIITEDIVDITEGFSGAQIENLLNEAMLNALRYDRTEFCNKDVDIVMNKMLAGWQPNEHEFTSDIIDHIAIHELGHTIVGLLSRHHSKVAKVVINLSSPKSPGYTLFEGSTSNLLIREALFEHLMILLGGRIAEEVFYGISVTTGAINDLEEAQKLAEKMIRYYGMGSNIIYPSSSEKYKELIDSEIITLLNEAYRCSRILIQNSKCFITETSEILKRDKIIKVDKLNELLQTKYKYLEKIRLNSVKNLPTI